MVVADANGDLNTQAIPTSESTTASNGLTLTGLDARLGGTLASATSIAQAGNTFGFTGGSVGIGIASPANTLHVVGGTRISSLGGVGDYSKEIHSERKSSRGSGDYPEVSGRL